MSILLIITKKVILRLVSQNQDESHRFTFSEKTFSSENPLPENTFCRIDVYSTSEQGSDGKIMTSILEMNSKPCFWWLPDVIYLNEDSFLVNSLKRVRIRQKECGDSNPRSIDQFSIKIEPKKFQSKFEVIF